MFAIEHARLLLAAVQQREQDKKESKPQKKNFAVVKTKEGTFEWKHVNKDFKEKDFSKVLAYTEDVYESIELMNKENAKLKK